jgi:branched-chain amino acid transport system substrate-binding protein
MARSALAAIAAAVAVLAVGCGNETPIRVGVLADCEGLFEAMREPILASVKLPLLERGGSLGGAGAASAVEGVRIGGRPVELVEGCAEAGIFGKLIDETRRLVESERVDVVVGPAGPVDGPVMKEIATRYPDVTFVLGSSWSQDVTMFEPRDNVFRFSADHQQSVAGLATYAYRDLGWRTAAIVADDYPMEWELADGFATEFCALGGRVTRDWNTFPPEPPRKRARRLAAEVDGVALLTAFSTPGPFMTAWGLVVDDVARRTVLGGPGMTITGVLEWEGVSPAGVVIATDLPVAGGTTGWRRRADALERFFPGVQADLVLSPIGFAFGDGMTAVVEALDAVDGDLGGRQRRFRDALATVEVDSPKGTIRLDDNRQAVAPAFLARVAVDRTVVPFRTIRGVDQTMGGLFAARREPVTREGDACAPRRPPPWAR